MDNTVVRRGIGAVVLALIAALLLGYLLKGKSEKRQEVADLKLADAPIQIFPNDGANTTTTDGTQTADMTAQGSTDGNAQQLANTDQSEVAVVGEADDATAGTEQKVDVADVAMDKTEGNPAVDKSATQVDASGQAALSASNVSQDGKVANFAIRPNQVSGSEVRPSISADGAQQQAQAPAETKTEQADATQATDTASTTQTAQAPAASGGADKANQASQASATANTSSQSNRLASSAPSKAASSQSSGGSRSSAPVQRTITKADTSGIKLVGEKRLPPVSAGVSRVNQAKEEAAAKAKEEADKAAVLAANAEIPNPVVPKAGTNQYVVQLLATSNKVKAVELQQTMHREGYQSFVSGTAIKGKPIYRVRIGAFVDKGQAITIQTRMKRRYLKNQYVQSSIVVRN